MIAEPTFIASLNGLCGFILMVEDGEVDAIVTWRMPAGQCIAPVSTNPLKLADPAAHHPVQSD